MADLAKELNATRPPVGDRITGCSGRTGGGSLALGWDDDTMLRIEKAPPAPLGKAVHALVSEACAEGFDWVGGLHAAWAKAPFDRDGEGLYLAWLGDDLVGSAAITEDHHLLDGTTGRLRFVYVAPRARRRGVGDRLAAACLACAGQRWSVVRLHTANPAAARLYARFGFTDIGASDARSTHALSTADARPGQEPGEPVLVTDRLQLRVFTEADEHTLAAIHADPEVMRFLGGPRTAQQTGEIVDTLIALSRAGKPAFWAVERLSDAKLLGMAGLHEVGHDFPFGPALEIGWRLSRDVWNQGYATEAARAALGHAFDAFGAARVYAFTAFQNCRSEAVMRKLQMRRVEGGDFAHPDFRAADPHAMHALFVAEREAGSR